MIVPVPENKYLANATPEAGAINEPEAGLSLARDAAIGPVCAGVVPTRHGVLASVELNICVGCAKLQPAGSPVDVGGVVIA